MQRFFVFISAFALCPQSYQLYNMRLRKNFVRDISLLRIFADADDANFSNSETSLMAKIDAEEIKSQLFALAASCDRGFGASNLDNEKAQTLIEKLRTINPTQKPTSNIYPSQNLENGTYVPLEGVWKLVYTTAFDVVSLAASPLTLLQGIYQVISRDGRSANVIDLAPRIQAALPRFLVGQGSTLRLIVGTSSYARSETRVGLTFKSITAKPLSLLGQSVSGFLPSLNSVLPQSIIRGDGEGPGYFDVLYLDQNCLIIAQNSPGGIFVNVRSDEPLESFLLD